MVEQALISQPALKYEVEVPDDGHLNLVVPFAPGTHVVVFVLGESNNSLVAETATSTEDLGDLSDLLAQARADLGDNPPRTGAEIVAYWQREGLLGTRPDITDSLEYAQALRRRVERRDRS